MSEDLRACLIVSIAFVVAVIFYINFYRNGTNRERFIENAKKKGNVAKAVCVKTKRILGDSNSNCDVYRNESKKVIYEYSVNGKKYRKKLYFQSPGMVSIDFPYAITVYYSEKNPRKAYSKAELNEVGRGCFLTVVVFCVVVAVLVRIIK